MSNFPGISIVICTFNGSARMEQTLQALEALEASFPWEIIIVDNASTDNTQEVCLNQLKGNNSNVSWKCISEPKPGLIYARKKGVLESSFPFVLFCDDDNWLAKDYLERAAETLIKDPEIGALGGIGIPFFEFEAPSWFDQYAHSFAVGPQNWHLGDSNNKLGYLYGASLVIRKELVLHIFHSDFELALIGRKKDSLVSGDDVEMCYLIQLQGYRLVYNERMKFSHYMPESRMNWDKYLSLKAGITKSAALLYSYQFFRDNPKSGLMAYTYHLTLKLFKNGLLYFKNLLGSKKNLPDYELSVLILKTRFLSFYHDFYKSIRHYKQLKQYF